MCLLRAARQLRYLLAHRHKGRTMIVFSRIVGSQTRIIIPVRSFPVLEQFHH